MEIIKIKINELKPYEKNAKIHTQEQIEQIKRSIEQFGMNDPIAVWGEENLIVEGHGRLEALKELGYDEVLELRKILETVSNKVIPVWHKNRGIEEYKKMCQDYAGRVIAITGFKNEDIKDEQYLMFLKYAKKYNCKVHCLGMTRKKILDKVPFDYVDSSSWVQSSIFGRIDGKGKVTKDFSKENRGIVFKENYINGTEMQKHYYKKWRKVNKD